MHLSVQLFFFHFLSCFHFLVFPWSDISFISPERGFCSDSLFQTPGTWNYWPQHNPIPTIKLSLLHPYLTCVCTSVESCLHCRITHSLAQMKRGKGRNKANPGKPSIWRSGQREFRGDWKRKNALSRRVGSRWAMEHSVKG